MRKLWMMLFALIALILTACGSSPQEDFAQRLGQAMKAPVVDSTPTTVLTNMRRVALASANVADTPSITPDQLFEWAEATHPQLFPTKEKTLTWSVYQFRYYKDTDVYLAVENGQKVVALGKPTGGTLLELGAMSLFEPQIVSFGIQQTVLNSFTIPDPAAYYKDQCEFPNISFVIPVKLNSDQLVDFIVHYWCSAPLPWGQRITTPTPDALVAFVSKKDGSYTVANEEVFGSRLYKLGGASRKFARGDINGDGRDDFAFAMNWEDGRAGANSEDYATEPSVLLSIPGGGYRVIRMGKPNFNHAVEIVRNPDSVDVVFAGFLGPLQAFRYDAGAFLNVSLDYVSDYPSHTWASSFKVIPDPASGFVHQIAAVSSRQRHYSEVYSLSEWGIKLFSKHSSVWTTVGEFWTKVEFMVGWVSWTFTKGRNTVVNVNGKQYFGGAYDEMCVMPSLLRGGSRLLLAKMGLQKDIQGRTLVAEETYSEQEVAAVNTYTFYILDDDKGLIPFKSPVVNEETDSLFARFDCKDINNDGLPDLVSYALTRQGFRERVAERGKPTIYLNDGNGQLVRMDLRKLPGHPAESELQSILADVNGDGIVDLILFGVSTDRGGGSIEVHLLRGQLKLP